MPEGSLAKGKIGYTLATRVLWLPRRDGAQQRQPILALEVIEKNTLQKVTTKTRLGRSWVLALPASQEKEKRRTPPA